MHNDHWPASRLMSGQAELQVDTLVLGADMLPESLAKHPRALWLWNGGSLAGNGKHWWDIVCVVVGRTIAQPASPLFGQT